LDEERIMQDILTQWSNGCHGYIPDIKPADIVCLTMENVNKQEAGGWNSTIGDGNRLDTGS